MPSEDEIGDADARPIEVTVMDESHPGAAEQIQEQACRGRRLPLGAEQTEKYAKSTKSGGHRGFLIPALASDGVSTIMRVSDSWSMGVSHGIFCGSTLPTARLLGRISSYLPQVAH